MLDHKTQAVTEAVEAVARFDERRNLRRSPFHLSACGGCGGPAFQQPCRICGFYPIGSDKGVYDPKVATFERFESLVMASGPGGRDGTIATWHARETFRSALWANRDAETRRIACEEAVAEAAEVPVADVRTVWDVVTEGTPVHRPAVPRFVHDGWSALEEAKSLSDRPKVASPRISSAVKEAAEAWVEALHDMDAQAMIEAVGKVRESLKDIGAATGPDGNVRHALQKANAAVGDLERVASLDADDMPHAQAFVAVAAEKAQVETPSMPARAFRP